MFMQLLTVWSDTIAVSAAIWLVLLVTVLYLGRGQAHQLFETTGRALFNAMRLAAHAVLRLEKRLVDRNRDVLLAMGRNAAEKTIEREFTRVSTLVDRDLGQYPTLHRKIADTIDKIEDDYRESIQSTPLPPAWSEVVDTIASLPSSADPALNKILTNIQEAIEDSHEETLKAFQKATLERHRHLSAMQPHWRSLQGNMDKVKATLDSLEERTRTIDGQMERYESIRKAEEPAVNALTASSITQFFIAGLVLVIASLGGLINFQLIALPMSEMVGGNSYIGALKTSDIAALVIILVEIAMGLFLLESLRITHLFPVIGSMDDRLRRRMIVITLTILTILASIEASLAYMRDLLALDRAALQQSLAGVGVVEAQFRWIPSIGQMVMGFILPFALAFVAIPLESFIHALRTVLGIVFVGLLRTVRVGLRLVGSLGRHACQILAHIYDLIIMVPLGIERLIRERTTAPKQVKRVANTATPNEEPPFDLNDTPDSAKPTSKRRRTPKIDPEAPTAQEATS